MHPLFTSVLAPPSPIPIPPNSWLYTVVSMAVILKENIQQNVAKVVQCQVMDAIVMSQNIIICTLVRSPILI